MYSRKQLYILRLAVDSFNSSRAQTLCDGFRRNIDSVIQKCWRMQYNVLLVTNAWTLSSPQWKKTISKSQFSHLLKEQVCWKKINLSCWLACWYIDNQSWYNCYCSDGAQFADVNTNFKFKSDCLATDWTITWFQGSMKVNGLIDSKNEIHLYVHSVPYFLYL